MTRIHKIAFRGTLPAAPIEVVLESKTADPSVWRETSRNEINVLNRGIYHRLSSHQRVVVGHVVINGPGEVFFRVWPDGTISFLS